MTRDLRRTSRDRDRRGARPRARARARVRAAGREGRRQRPRRRARRRAAARQRAGGRGRRRDPSGGRRGDRQRRRRRRLRRRPARSSRQALDAFGRLDVVVNNAGLRARPHVRELPRGGVGRRHPRAPEGPLLRRRATPATYWRDRVEGGQRRSTRASSTRARGAGLQGSVGQSAYSAAKAGIAALTLVQAAELGALRRHRERDRAVGAHAHDRGGLRRHDEEARRAASTSWIPANVSPLVVWLGSAESRDVTGRVFEVAGGKISARRRLARRARRRQGRALGARRDRRRRARAAREGGAAAEGVRDLESDAMQFAFTEEQEELRARRARLPRRALRPPSACARRWRASSATTPTLWKRIGGELGWTAVAIPEAHGGLGLGYVELVALLEEMGEALLCAPFFSTVVPRGARAARGRRARRSERASCCRASPRGARPRRSRRASAAAPGSRGRDHARARPRAAIRARRREEPSCSTVTAADLLVVAARAPGSSGDAGICALRGCPATRAGVERRALPTMDQTRRLAEGRAATACACRTRARLGDRRRRAAGARAHARPRRDRARRRAGRRRAALPRHRRSRTRRSACSSGGRSARFQAIKHKCADMMVAVESARSAAYYAACVADDEPARISRGRRRSPRPAARRRTSAAPPSALQIHGGVGFTWEYDVHLHFKRARSTRELPRHARLAPRARRAARSALT